MSGWNYIKEIWRGKDLYRIFMNNECAHYTLSGKVVDLGSGVNQASYYRFFQKGKTMEIAALDVGFGSQPSEKNVSIDFEKDALPYQDNSIDTVLVFNIFEHVYRYSFLLKEIHRILKPGGRMIGAVPFLVGYHPDPHDFWRYTSETLAAAYETALLRDVKVTVLGRGPFSAAYSQVEFVLPRVLRFLILPGSFFADWIVFLIKPKLPREKFALGLFFSASK
ncbi:MAG: methyltransferase domain-containing protein [Parcubacteria group bacterium]|nr:methyltransferase domain-containing protein [Parcubacteria group bacterium]